MFTQEIKIFGMKVEIKLSKYFPYFSKNINCRAFKNIWSGFTEEFFIYPYFLKVGAALKRQRCLHGSSVYTEPVKLNIFKFCAPYCPSVRLCDLSESCKPLLAALSDKSRIFAGQIEFQISNCYPVKKSQDAEHTNRNL